MSRGHGALQRQILELLEKQPEGAPPLKGNGLPGEWTARELCHAIYWHNGSGAGEDRRYSLMASIRVVTGPCGQQGCDGRRPASSHHEPGKTVPVQGQNQWRQTPLVTATNSRSDGAAASASGHREAGAGPRERRTIEAGEG